MSFLSRKVSRAKWERRDGLAEHEVPADAVTADLKTTDNTLSFWRCSEASEAEIRKTVLALATAAQRLDRIDVAWVAEELFRSENLTLAATEGRTPVTSIRDRHVDVARLDVCRFAKVAQLIGQALQAGQHKRFTKKEVLAVVTEAVNNNLVFVEELKDKFREEVKQSLGEGGGG